MGLSVYMRQYTFLITILHIIVTIIIVIIIEHSACYKMENVHTSTINVPSNLQYGFTH